MALALTLLVSLLLTSLGGIDLRDPETAILAGAPANSTQVEQQATAWETGTPPSELPDLVIDELRITIDPDPAQCQQAPLGTWLRVANAGMVDAAAFRVRVHGRGYDAPPLKAGGTVAIWFAHFSDEGASETVAEVDVGDAVAESREDNNRVALILPSPTPAATCTPSVSPTPYPGAPPPLPDLLPSATYSWHCPCLPCPDAPPYGTVCIENRGEASAHETVNLLDFGWVSELLVSPALGVAGPRSRVCRTIPSISLLVVADAPDRVAESDERNNRRPVNAPTYSPPPPCSTNPSARPMYIPVLETRR